MYSLITLLFMFIVWLVIFLKKRRQFGKSWDGPLSAVVTIKGKELRCSHCGHDKFEKREGLITTTWVTFFRFPFFNRSARCFVCKECRLVHWFVGIVEQAVVKRERWE